MGGGAQWTPKIPCERIFVFKMIKILVKMNDQTKLQCRNKQVIWQRYQCRSHNLSTEFVFISCESNSRNSRQWSYSIISSHCILRQNAILKHT